MGRSNREEELKYCAKMLDKIKEGIRDLELISLVMKPEDTYQKAVDTALTTIIGIINDISDILETLITLSRR